MLVALKYRFPVQILLSRSPWIGIVIIEPVLLAYSLDNVKTVQSLPSNEEWQDNLLTVIRTYSVK